MEAAIAECLLGVETRNPTDAIDVVMRSCFSSKFSRVSTCSSE